MNDSHGPVRALTGFLIALLVLPGLLALAVWLIFLDVPPLPRFVPCGAQRREIWRRPPTPAAAA